MTKKINKQAISDSNQKEVKAISKQSWTKPQKLTFLGFVIFVILFLMVWIEPSMNFMDPWYEAITLVDSSRKVNDQALKSKLLDEGGKKLKELAAKHPYHARVQHYLGIYYSFAGQLDSAIACQERAIKIGSGGLVNNVEFDAQRELISAIGAKAMQFFQNKQMDSSISYLEKAVSESDKFKMTQQTAKIVAQIKNNLGVAYLQKGNDFLESKQYDTALVVLNKALSNLPNNSDVMNSIGIAYSKTGNNEKAQEFFKKALELNPKNDNVRNNLQSVQNKN